MKINSKYRDYYDGVQSHGFDSDLVWLRIPEPIQGRVYNYGAEDDPCDPILEEINELIETWVEDTAPGYLDSEMCFAVVEGRKKCALEVRKVAIIFCGALYRGVTLEVNTWTPDKVIRAFRMCWTQADVEKACRDLSISWNDTRKFHGSRSPQSKFKTPEEWLNSMFIVKKELEKTRNWALKTRIPILAIGKDPHNTIRRDFEPRQIPITKNALLKDFEFYRIVSPEQVYQELAMFLSNVANPDPVMVQLTDMDKQKKFGFTHQYSFRKEPGEKRIKKRRHK